jgi:FixJ family two-component response regulator
MRWLVHTMFADHFTDVIEVADGRALFWELVRCARSLAAEDVVVITDLRMPHYSGLDVIDAYGELGYHPPTVVMTSFPDADAYTATARAGGVLLSKPFATAELRRSVEHVCQR